MVSDGWIAIAVANGVALAVAAVPAPTVFTARTSKL